MQGLNSVHLLGRAYNVKTMVTKTGKPMTFFTLTTYEKQGEGKQDKALFHNCVSYGKLAEMLAERLSDKKIVFVDGVIDYYEKDGVRNTQIRVNSVSFSDENK